jgi:hypothetical protein
VEVREEKTKTRLDGGLLEVEGKGQRRAERRRRESSGGVNMTKRHGMHVW